MPINQLATSSIDAVSFSIAQGYFASILNAQLIIFSLIVGALVSLYFLFKYKISNEAIKKEVDESVGKVREDLKKEFEQQVSNAKQELSEGLQRHENEIGLLRGQVYRSMGQFWDSQKSYAVAFVWWMRAATQFANVGDERMTRISLNSTKHSIEKIKWAWELNTDWIGEYQKIFTEIPDTLYKVEKDLLDTEFKKALERKPPEPTLPVIS